MKTKQQQNNLEKVFGLFVSMSHYIPMKFFMAFRRDCVTTRRRKFIAFLWEFPEVFFRFFYLFFRLFSIFRRIFDLKTHSSWKLTLRSFFSCLKINFYSLPTCKFAFTLNILVVLVQFVLCGNLHFLLMITAKKCDNSICH